MSLQITPKMPAMGLTALILQPGRLSSSSPSLDQADETPPHSQIAHVASSSPTFWHQVSG